MAVYRCEVKRISRSSGRSAVAAAAYRSASRLHDERSDKSHDYSRKARGVAARGIVAPEHAPSWAHDREQLWNAAEAAERRKDANTAREVLVSLPHELDDAQRVELVERFSGDLVNRYGMVVDYAIHHPDRRGDNRNHHAHLMLTTRRMGRDGLQEKTRELDDRTTGPKEIEEIRRLWENEQNRALDHADLNERVSRLSNKARGIELEPEPKIGHQANAMLRRGVVTPFALHTQQVRQRNASMRENMRRQAEEKRRQPREASNQNLQQDFNAQGVALHLQAEADAPRAFNLAAASGDRGRQLHPKTQRETELTRHQGREGQFNQLANDLMRDSSAETKGREIAHRLKQDASEREDEEQRKRAQRLLFQERMKARQAEIDKAKKQNRRDDRDRGLERELTPDE